MGIPQMVKMLEMPGLRTRVQFLQVKIQIRDRVRILRVIIQIQVRLRNRKDFQDQRIHLQVQQVFKTQSQNRSMDVNSQFWILNFILQICK